MLPDWFTGAGMSKPNTVAERLEGVSVCLLHVHVMASNREILSIDKTMTLEN